MPYSFCSLKCLVCSYSSKHYQVRTVFHNEQGKAQELHHDSASLETELNSLGYTWQSAAEQGLLTEKVLCICNDCGHIQRYAKKVEPDEPDKWGKATCFLYILGYCVLPIVALTYITNVFIAPILWVVGFVFYSSWRDWLDNHTKRNILGIRCENCGEEKCFYVSDKHRYKCPSCQKKTLYAEVTLYVD